MSFLLINKAKKLIDTKIADFKIELAQSKEPVSFNDKDKLNYKQYKIGESWGQLFDCAWFKLTTKLETIPSEDIYIKFDINAEALLFSKDGVPLKGFTNGSSNFGFMGHLGNPQKRYYKINDFIDKDGNIELYLDAGMNDLFGNVKRKGKIEIVEVVTRDYLARTLYYDLKSIYSLMIFSFKRDKEAFRKYRKGFNNIKRIKKDFVSEALKITTELLKTPTKADHQISSIGHAHLDLAWLWPIRETRRKGARTFANILRLMDQYEDFRFGASQPQLYQWVKDEHPELYEQIKEKVKTGQWEVQGGMWVEADTNVSGEEALVRQMLYGIRFFEQEFGKRVKSLWLPDVFGYSGNMPQIIKKSGLDYFMTIKISWNDTTKFPHHTFTWKGIDGSDVFAHMPPEGEYNSPANTYFLLKSMEKYRERKIDNQTLNLFGVGDGGGGPSASHIERIRRLDGVAPMPNVKMEQSATFFERLGKIKDKFPTYKGELYLEKHRGTYTSQGRVKYFNRKMEQKLKTIELLLVQTNQYSKYKTDIERIWKEVLLYQFHDILPGSSIKRVYDECLARYEELDNETDELIAEILGAKISKGSYVSVYNPLQKDTFVSRVVGDEFHEYNVAAMSNKIISKVVYKKSGRNSINLENNLIKVEFSKDGSIKSIYDKVNKRQVNTKKMNQLTVYTDIANAWDIYRYYRYLPKSKAKLVDTQSYQYGEIQVVEQKYKYKKSTIKQIIILKPEQAFIDFDLEIDWQNNKKMLRTAFPLNLKTDEAIFDIQFGHIKRSTKSDTKALKAQYEASGHNWVDMNNKDWGVALVTDSKYGFKVKESTLDLHLIKSTNYPAKQGDIGLHKIKYGLLIHEGDHNNGVDQFAMEYNTYYPITEKADIVNNHIFTVDNDAIVYSSVKQAEDSESIIIRLYEREGKNNRCVFNTMNGYSIYETNMVEENPILLSESNKVELEFTEFEVKTIMIKKG